MKELTERITKLLTIKSIVTIIFTIVFAYLSITGGIGEQQFIALFTMVIAFYFGTQASKE